MAAAAAGCGGGSQGAGSAGGGVHSSKAGEAVFTYSGQPKPQVAIASGAVSVLGQAGATFSTVTLEPPPNLNDTYLVFSRTVGGISQLYELPYSGGSAQLLYHTTFGALFPSISAYGEVIFNVVTTDEPTWEVRPDGTGVKQLFFTGAPSVESPVFSQDGTNRVAFYDGDTGVDIAPGAGGAATQVQTNGFGPVTWNPAGNQLMYVGSIGSKGNTDIFTTPTAGGTHTDVTPTGFVNQGDFDAMCWNADGVTALAMYEASGTSELIEFPVTSKANVLVVTPSGDADSAPCWSPDGSQMAFVRSSSGGATPGVYMADAAGGNQTLVLPDPAGNLNSVNGGMSWSPFLPKETVIAASASTFYHQAASGFLLSQNSGQFGSLVAFTAPTPSSAAIQTPGDESAKASMIFTITADGVTSIGYINNYFNSGTTITLSSTPSVVVSIDASTGQVDLVAPAADSKSSSVKNADGTVTYNGRFKGLYDAVGKNLAPSGASRLTIDPKTGKLVAFKLALNSPPARS